MRFERIFLSALISKVSPATMLGPIALLKGALSHFLSRTKLMSQPVESIQAQLDRAQANLKLVEARLDGKELKKQPHWREANAAVVQLERRVAASQTRHASATAGDESEASSDE